MSYDLRLIQALRSQQQRREWLTGHGLAVVGVALALSVVSGACDAAPLATQILVVVDSDLTVGSELTRVGVAVFDRSGSTEALAAQSFQLRIGGESPLSYSLPLSFAIAPNAVRSSRDFKLVVTGRGRPDGALSEVDVVEQRVIASFEPNASLRLGVFLARECYGNLCRDEAGDELTCVRGACVKVPMLTDLPRADATPLAGYVPPVPDDTADDTPPGETDMDGGAETGGPGADATVDGDDAQTSPDPLDGAADGETPDAGDGAIAGDCGPGFAPTAGGACADIDECATVNHRCDALNTPCEQTAPPGYTCRGLLADWGMPARVNGGQSVFNYDAMTTLGTVVDETTGLQWERTAAAAQVTYASALAYCDTLTLAGLSDWRLPSQMELFSLVDEARTGDANELAIDSNNFPIVVTNANSTLFWSSSRDTSSATASRLVRRIVNFSDATATGFYMETAALPVRCVRRARLVTPGVPSDRFVRDTPTTSLDRRTGLIWQVEPAGPFAWPDAVAYCASQSTTGTPRPFRLPGYKELRTLVDIGSPSNNSVFTDALGNFTGRTFWSSSEFGRSTATNAYYVEFLDGNAGIDLKTKQFFARCVRSSVD